MPSNTIYVGRPSKWGNPFKTGEDFREWLYCAGTLKYKGRYGAGAGYRGAVISELRGKDLACWCKPGNHCHAEVLLSLANGLKLIW